MRTDQNESSLFTVDLAIAVLGIVMILSSIMHTSYHLMHAQCNKVLRCVIKLEVIAKRLLMSGCIVAKELHFSLKKKCSFNPDPGFGLPFVTAKNSLLCVLLDQFKKKKPRNESRISLLSCF